MASLKDTTTDNVYSEGNSITAPNLTVEDIEAGTDDTFITRGFLGKENASKRVRKILSRGAYAQTGVLTEDDKILIWGNTNQNNLGLGNAVNQNTPTEVQFPSYLSEFGVRDAVLVGNNGYVLFENNELWGWGYNYRGTLGIGNTTTQRIPLLCSTNVLTIIPPENLTYQHNDFRFFITKTNSSNYWGCGYNAQGGLGIGTNVTAESTWLDVGIPTTWKLYNFGGTYGCAFVTHPSETTKACGKNGYGQLGVGNTTSPQKTWIDVVGTLANLYPTHIESASGHYNTAAYGTGSSFFTISTGAVWAVGDDGYGQLGNASTVDISTAIEITTVGTCERVSQIGTLATMFVKSTSVYRAGRNAEGQLFDSTTTNTGANPPVEYIPSGTLNGVWTFSRGNTYSYETGVYLLIDNTLYASGDNGAGELGVGSTGNKTSLVEVPTPVGKTVVDIQENGYTQGGRYHQFLMDDGTLYTAGYGGRNNIGDGFTNNAWTMRRVWL